MGHRGQARRVGLPLAVFLVLAVWTGPAQAQTKPPAPKSPSQGEGQKYGAWTYRCDPLPASAPPGTQPACFISQVVSVKTNGGREARMLMVNASRFGPERKPILFVFVPWGAAVQQDVILSVDGGPPVNGRMDTCLAEGCRLTLLLPDEFAERVRKGRTLSVTFTPLGGQPMKLDAVLDGFESGLAAVK
jgi:invasion protein IalB